MSLLNKIAIGTVQFGMSYGISNKEGITTVSEVTKILNYAHSLGLRKIDTAFSYGISEKILGLNYIKSFDIISKFSAENQNELMQQYETTLKNLKVKSIYGYLAHHAQLLKNPGILDCLYKIKQTTPHLKIGVSLNKTEDIDIIQEANFYPEIIQIPFNYFDNRFQSYALQSRKWNCEVHSRSPFLQGLFFCDPKNLDLFFNPLKNSLNHLQQKPKLSASLLKYSLSKSFIDYVVMGVNTVSQLIENLENIPDAEELVPIEEQFDHNLITPSEWPRK